MSTGPRKSSAGRSPIRVGAAKQIAPLDGGHRETTATAVSASQPAPAEPPTPTPAEPAPRPAETATRAFTARLDVATLDRFGRLTRDMVHTVGTIATRVMDKHSGRVRGGYAPSQADLLRALLVVAENDPAVRAQVYEQVRAQYPTSRSYGA